MRACVRACVCTISCSSTRVISSGRSATLVTPIRSATLVTHHNSSFYVRHVGNSSSSSINHSLPSLMSRNNRHSYTRIICVYMHYSTCSKYEHAKGFQWPCDLRRRSSAASLLGSRLRIPLKLEYSFVFVVCCVGRGLCDERNIR